MIDSVQFDALPLNWTSFDLATFSGSKRLWEYQQEGVKNALKALWRYYQDFVDYQPGEATEANRERKRNRTSYLRDTGHTGLTTLIKLWAVSLMRLNLMASEPRV
ncbi:MAG: hypothetical protein HY314_01970 [Acidobacteria bacterium]|nr:hypothetical protein [Acidobacteriota bacterium]